MLKLRPRNGRVRYGCFRTLKSDLSLGHGFVIVETQSVPDTGEFKRLPVYLDSLLEKFFERVLAAQFKIENRQIRLFRKLLIFKIGRACLCRVGKLTHGVANASPEIGLPTNIKRKVEQVAVWIAVRKT